MSDLNFDGLQFNVVMHNNQPCLTLAEIAAALYGTACQRGSQIETPFETRVRNIYRRHADEFTESMTSVLKLQTAGGVQDVRVFSLRGAHLLGMLAHSKRAKEFRGWVLDVLEQQAAEANTILCQYHRAVAVLRAEEEVASWHGHGLNVWKGKKQPMKSNAKRLYDELQLRLPGFE